MTSGGEIPRGSKYAVMAISVTEDIDLTTWTEIRAGLGIARRPPFDLPKHWTELLGSLRTERIGEANLFLVAHAASQTLRDLDDDNRKLQKAVEKLHFALLFAAPHTPGVTGNYLTGAAHEDETDVREAGGVHETIRTAGSPFWTLDEDHVDRAREILEGMSALEGRNEFDRTWRMTHAFHAALGSQQFGERLHQFMRCIEGAILPEPGKTEKQFKSRTELFIGPNHHPLIELLYVIRSAVEHVHNPLDATNAVSERDRLLCLAKSAYQAEAIAHHCIQRIFARQELREHFNTDENLKAFWALTPDNRRELWGEVLDLDELSATFNEQTINI